MRMNAQEIEENLGEPLEVHLEGLRKDKAEARKADDTSGLDGLPMEPEDLAGVGA